MKLSKSLLLLGGVLLCFLLGSAAISSPAVAVLRQHQDQPGIMRYHAQHSLQDKAGNAWQLVLFPQYQSGKLSGWNLRVVGFPGLAKLMHPQPLEVITAEGKLLTAADVFAESAPAPNVGQYDFTKILPRLPQNKTLQLSVPVSGNHTLSLHIPTSIVREWQLLAKEM